MNETVKRFLLAGETFMTEMHLRQLRFTNSPCGTFTKTKEKIQEFKETGDSRYIYQNKLNKTCFQHSLAYEYFKDLTGRIATDKTFMYDEAFDSVKIFLSMIDIYVEFLQWPVNFLIKNIWWSN